MDTFSATTSSRRPSTSVETATSWGDFIKGIEAEKRTLPWQPQDVQPPVKVSMFERKTKERELDPIVMEFRKKETEVEHSASRMNRTHTQPLQRYETIKRTQFNIVSHEGPPRKLDAMRKEQNSKPNALNRGWHLFSHLGPKQHVECPTLYDEKYMETNVRPKTGAHVPNATLREFNIINNEFTTNHDERLREEYNTMKGVMVKKYWDTHNFDILRQEYYDDSKEEDFKHGLHEATLVHGQAQTAKLPTSFKYSEGRSYDILNHDIKDARLIKVALRKGEQKQNRLTKFRHLPQEQNAAAMAEYEKWEARRLNRVSYQRWEAEIERGYDFVHTTEQHKDPLPKRPVSMWKRISIDPPRASSAANNSFSASTTVNSGDNSARNGLNPPVSRPTSNKVPSLDMRSVRTGGLSEYL